MQSLPVTMAFDSLFHFLQEILFVTETFSLLKYSISSPKNPANGGVF
jgi:hypothetical protein